MQGIVFPRPHRWAVDKKGRRYKAPLRPNEEWTDPDTGKVTKAGPNGSSWSYSITTGSRARGDRRTHEKGGFPTKKAAEAELTKVAAALGKGDMRPLLKRSTQTLGEHLDEWLAACEIRANKPLKPGTADGYRTAIRAWISPFVGRIPLADLDRDHLIGNAGRGLEGLYPILRARGARPTAAERKAADREGRKAVGRPLGSRSVQLCHAILSKALRAAVALDKIPVNPMDRIPDDNRPTHTPQKSEDRHWSPMEAAAYLAHTADDRLHALDAVALDSGARRGELAGLRWDLVDLDDGTMRIRRNRTIVKGVPVEGTPKTKNSVRDIALHPATTDVLRAWRKAQVAERLAAGKAWGVPNLDDPEAREAARVVNTAGGGYVFCDELGRPGSPDWLSDRFERQQDGFDGARTITFHGLRHTSATTALAGGMPVHLVSARLGHSSISVTVDIYGHVIPGDDDKVAAVIGDAIWGLAATSAVGS